MSASVKWDHECSFFIDRGKTYGGVECGKAPLPAPSKRLTHISLDRGLASEQVGRWMEHSWSDVG